MTHRDGYPRLSARSAWCGDAGHRKPCGTPSAPRPKALGSRRPGRAGEPAVGDSMGASESLADVPHRLRLPSYPADRLPDLYGSLSTLLGIRARRVILPGYLHPDQNRSAQQLCQTTLIDFFRPGCAPQRIGGYGGDPEPFKVIWC